MKFRGIICDVLLLLYPLLLLAHRALSEEVCQSTKMVTHATSNSCINVIAKASIASGLLFYGDLCPKSMLLYHGIKAVGWPLLKDNLFQWKKVVVSTKEVIDKSLPIFREKIQQIYDLEAKLAVLKEQEKISATDERQSILILDGIQKSKVAIEELGSTYSHIKAAIDPDRLKVLLYQLYAAILACIGIASSNVAQSCAIGFNIGNLISNRIIEDLIRPYKEPVLNIFYGGIRMVDNPLVAPVLEEVQKYDWLELYIRFISVCGGIALTFIFQKLSIKIGSCTVGADLLQNSLRQLLNSIFSCHTFPSGVLVATHGLVTLLHGKLLEMGIQRALRGGTADLPPPSLRKLFLPVEFIEKLVSSKAFFKEHCS